MRNLRWLVLATAVAHAGALAPAVAQTLPPPTNLRIGSGALPPGVTLREPDGGANYFGRFTGSLPTSPSFFPLAVWFESVTSQADIDKDKGAGLNTYVVLTGNSNASLVASNGMHYFAHAGEWVQQLPFTRSGWELDDEVDMRFSASQGFARLSSILSTLPADNKPRYANYGKGVLSWLSDANAAQYINQYPDVTSADLYFWTDPHVCGETEGGWLYVNIGLFTDQNVRALTNAECRNAWNYGYVIDRLRQLDGMTGGTAPAQRKPMWAFVEVGNPWTEVVPPITPVQLRSAVWHSIIAGARGVIYFNHTFGGPCQTQHALRDSCYASIRAAVLSVNQQITQLAPVLNASFADGYVTASSGVRTMAKRGPDGAWYVFAGARQHASQTATFNVAAGSSVEVMFEGRTRPISSGQFTDTFADGQAVHVYRITN